jgi:hypothetical protein
VTAAEERFGPIDMLVDNAGCGYRALCDFADGDAQWQPKYQLQAVAAALKPQASSRKGGDFRPVIQNNGNRLSIEPRGVDDDDLFLTVMDGDGEFCGIGLFVVPLQAVAVAFRNVPDRMPLGGVQRRRAVYGHDILPFLTVPAPENLAFFDSPADVTHSL